MTRFKFFASLVASVVGLLGFNKRAKSHTSIEEHWEIVRNVCMKHSGIDGNGILIDGNNLHLLKCNSLHGCMASKLIYSYSVTAVNGKEIVERVYLLPIKWGAIKDM